MGWLYLVVAGLLEIGWAIGMKFSEGFTKAIPSVLTAVGMILTYVFLSLAVKTLPLGTSYAVWTGIGTAGAVVSARIFFGETLDIPRIICISLIIIGILGLKFLTPSPSE